MRLFVPNIKQGGIGGGWSFLRTLKNGLKDKVHFVNSWQECDIFFITGITIVNPSEVYEAKKAGKKIVLRVDNVPRKSRNRRSTPHERLKEFAELADVVIYQSEWAKNYCEPLCGDGTIIYNGVDKKIFSSKGVGDNHPNKANRYLFAYHGKNELKQFWLAHFYFQMIFRKNPKAEFVFIYDFGKELTDLQNAKFDFWQGEKYEHRSQIQDPLEMAELMRTCTALIYPSTIDASPNIVLEARACGLDVFGTSESHLSGSKELLSEDLDISSERMCDEYYGIFDLLVNTNV